jgi:hypothetical protein
VAADVPGHHRGDLPGCAPGDTIRPLVAAAEPAAVEVEDRTVAALAAYQGRGLAVQAIDRSKGRCSSAAAAASGQRLLYRRPAR